jgi:hypothetical protein
MSMGTLKFAEENILAICLEVRADLLDAGFVVAE